MLEKCTKKYEEFEIQLQDFEQEMFTNYSELHKANRELKIDISGLEQAVNEANQIFNKITDELNENKVFLQERSTSFSNKRLFRKDKF